MPETAEVVITDAEKDAINELREKFKNTAGIVYEDTYFFQRFLQAQNHDVAQAEIAIKKMLEWRKKVKADRLIQEYKKPEVLEEYFRNTRIGADKTGRLIHFCPIGKTDPRGLFMSAKFEDMEKTYVYTLEEDENTQMEKREKVGDPYPGIIHIYDMDGLSFATATDKKALEYFIHMMKIYQDFYPERLRAVYVINISTYFMFPLNIVKACLSSAFVDKAKFFSADGYQEALLEIIDADVLPAFLGGKRTDPDGNPLCKTIVVTAGKIDEKYYIHKSKNPLSTSPGVKKIVLARASFSEIELEVKEDGSLIEWEFETKTRDVGFGLFYKEVVEGEEKITELVPLLRIDTEDYSETGVFKCEKAGTYVVLFDNSYSWIRSKEIYYRINVIGPKELQEQLKADK